MVVATLDEGSIDYLVTNFKSYPAMFVCHGRTPLIHPRLYSKWLPKAIQGAYAICASYLTKTEVNKNMVFRIMEAMTDELIQDYRRYSSFADHLACVQALTLVHTIQLFDGDIRQRGLAEQHDGTLRQWTEQLWRRMNDQLPEFQSPWQAWISAESAAVRSSSHTYFELHTRS